MFLTFLLLYYITIPWGYSLHHNEAGRDGFFFFCIIITGLTPRVTVFLSDPCRYMTASNHNLKVMCTSPPQMPAKTTCSSHIRRPHRQVGVTGSWTSSEKLSKHEKNGNSWIISEIFHLSDTSIKYIPTWLYQTPVYNPNFALKPLIDPLM